MPRSRVSLAVIDMLGSHVDPNTTIHTTNAALAETLAHIIIGAAKEVLRDTEERTQ